MFVAGKAALPVELTPMVWDPELRPVGVAEIAGERLDVTTEGEWLPAGTPISVIKAEPMRLVVRRVAQLST